MVQIHEKRVVPLPIPVCLSIPMKRNLRIMVKTSRSYLQGMVCYISHQHMALPVEKRELERSVLLHTLKYHIKVN